MLFLIELRNPHLSQRTRKTATRPVCSSNQPRGERVSGHATAHAWKNNLSSVWARRWADSDGFCLLTRIAAAAVPRFHLFRQRLPMLQNFGFESAADAKRPSVPV